MMMTDEKANTEEQSNMEDQVTENSVDASAEEVIASTEVTEEAAVESNETAVEPSSEVESTEEVANEEVTAPEAEAAVEEEASAEAEPTEEVAVTEVAESKEPAPVVEEVVVKKEKKVDDGKRWYSLRVISGNKIRQGKKVISERNILPGYILVEALAKNFTGEMVQTITGMPNVIHFLGRNNPIPMQQSEANRMLGKVDESQDVGESLLEPFIVGETVKIIDGPFNEFVGDIQEINDEKKKLKVIVKIFGRGTEVELNFVQVDKQT